MITLRSWNMLWRALLLVCTVECMERAIILSPEFNKVLENRTLELTCRTPVNFTYTIWETLNQRNNISYMSFVEKGKCETDGFLSDTKHFETRCYSNGTFKLIIKRVSLSYHGQKWFCYFRSIQSNFSFISVQVPTKYVVITNISSNSLMTVEKIKITLVCVTSDSRPAANVTWMKISKSGIKTDLTSDTVYNISREETVTERDLIIVSSSIDIEPVRHDNNCSIICEATNMKSYIARKEIMIFVQYPCEKPYFEVSGQNVTNGSVLSNKLSFEEFSSFTVLCKAHGNPSPICTWNVSWSQNSPSLTFTNVSKKDRGFYTCFAENIINGSNSAEEILTEKSSVFEIDVLYPSSVVMFYVVGLEQKDDVFEVTESETISFNCSVDSNPKSLIYLSFREKELKRNISASALLYTHLIASCFDGGVYICAARNSYNIKSSVKELKLLVRCTPRVSPEFNVTSTFLTTPNDSVTFEFEVVANPLPIFTWYKLGVSKWISLSTGNKYEINTTGLSSKLSVTNISEQDFGHYKLEIRNDVGFLEQLYFLQAKEDKDQDSVELSSRIPRLFPIAAGSLIGAASLVAVLVFVYYKHTCTRRDENARQQTEEVVVHQRTSDDENMYEVINDVYEHLNEQFKENDLYTEMKRIETQDSNKDYLTPIV